MALFGAKLTLTPTNGANFGDETIGKNSEQFTKYDVVSVGTNGLFVNTGSDPVKGVVVQSLTMNAANETGQINPVVAGVSNTGLNDATSGGTYTAFVGHTYVVEIDSTGTPDTFKVSEDGVVIATLVSITGAPQTLANGVTITFAATTGHTLGDQFIITVTIFQVKPIYIPTDQIYQFLMRSNSPMTPLSVGQVYDLIGGTGAQLLDVAGGAATVAEVMSVDPFATGDYTLAFVKFVLIA